MRGLVGFLLALLIGAPAFAQSISPQPGCVAGLACQASSLAINGATIGSNALAVTGASSLAGNVTVTTGDLKVSGVSNSVIANTSGLFSWDTRAVMKSPDSSTINFKKADTITDAVVTFGNGVGSGYIKTQSTTVSGLTACSTAGAGARSFVTDATATTFLSAVSGGGANKVPVVCDGANWLIG
jgi:hypothetical protein